MFLAHINDIPKDTWKVLEQFQQEKTLLNDNGKFFLQSNICTHQGSRIRQGSGSNLNARCPYHGWTWDKTGSSKGSGTVGHSTGSSLCKNTYPLETTEVYEWSGFLFSEPVPVDRLIDGDYKLVEYRCDTINASYIPIMDLFLDIDHIPLVHPGVYKRINVPDVEDITWKQWTGGSAQFVVGSAVDTGFDKFIKGKGLAYNAIWLAQYPDTMFEWQPGAVFVMINEPLNSTQTKSHVFKYRDFNYPEENWKVNEEVWETAWQQDKEQAERMEPAWSRVKLENLDKEKQIFRAWLNEHK
jgi:phenylpropionate dioxygenase-like ring-hydroxylating dioxygenase large terminal subunit